MEKIVKNNRKRTKNEIIEDVIFYVFIMPLVVITAAILLQTIIHPDKIPNVFGYKMFIVLDGNMEQTVSYGDLTFTKNIDTNKLKVNDIIAFRNAEEKVTIHKISEITEENFEKIFVMQAKTNETNDTKYVKEEAVEGILVKKIDKVGIIIMYLQEPFVVIFIACFILIIGLVLYYNAQGKEKKKKQMDNNSY